MERPMSYYVAASKRSRERREQLGIHLRKRNKILEEEISGLSSRATSLKEELNTLMQTRESNFRMRRKDEIINDSLKLQILEHRILFAKLRGQFMEMDQNLVRLAVLDAMKQNINFVFHEMETAMQRTNFIQDALPFDKTTNRLRKKKQLYREMLNVICRYLCLSSETISDQFDEEVVLHWAPDLDFSELTSKRADLFIVGEERTRRYDIYDIPFSPLFLQEVFRRINFLSILAMSSEALRRNIQENNMSIARPTTIVFKDAWHLPLDLLPKSDEFVNNFHIALSKPSSLFSEDLAILSASSMSNDGISPSYLVQCPVKDQRHVVEDEAERGGLYFKGISFKQGKDANHTDFTILGKFKKPLQNRSEFSYRVGKLGGDQFMEEQEPRAAEPLNVMEAILKCSIFVYLSLFHKP